MPTRATMRRNRTTCTSRAPTRVCERRNRGSSSRTGPFSNRYRAHERVLTHEIDPDTDTLSSVVRCQAPMPPWSYSSPPVHRSHLQSESPLRSGWKSISTFRSRKPRRRTPGGRSNLDRNGDELPPSDPARPSVPSRGVRTTHRIVAPTVGDNRQGRLGEAPEPDPLEAPSDATVAWSTVTSCRLARSPRRTRVVVRVV